MAFILGYIVGVWLIYALLALIFKHKIGLVVSAALYIFIGILNVISENGVISLISSIIAICIIGFVPPIQVRSKRKTEWKNARKQNTEQDNSVVDENALTIIENTEENNEYDDIHVNDSKTDFDKNIDRKENNNMEKITRSMSLECYGSNSRKIYVSLCQKFNWDINRQGDFGRQGVRSYAKNCTPEGYSVWFLGHNNWTDTKSSAWKNEISGDLVIETWEIREYGLFEDDTKRIIFAKKDNGQYVFLGVYGVIGVKEDKDSDGKRIWKKTYKRISDTYPV